MGRYSQQPKLQCLKLEQNRSTNIYADPFSSLLCMNITTLARQQQPADTGKLFRFPADVQEAHQKTTHIFLLAALTGLFLYNHVNIVQNFFITFQRSSRRQEGRTAGISDRIKTCFQFVWTRKIMYRVTLVYLVSIRLIVISHFEATVRHMIHCSATSITMLVLCCLLPVLTLLSSTYIYTEH